MNLQAQSNANILIAKTTTSWLAVTAFMTGLAAAQPSTVHEIGNALIVRKLSIRDGNLHTIGFEDRRAGKFLAVDSQEFLLRIGTNEFTAADFRVQSVTPTRAASGRQLQVGLTSSVGIELDVIYDAPRDKPCLRKWLVVRSTTGDAPVLRDVQVERFQARAKTDLGGLGQPVFINGAFFAGLEYPASLNQQKDGLVTLEHHPGRTLSRDFWRSRIAVIGASGGSDIEEAFAAYVRGIRRPPRSLVGYYSWYDLQADTLNEYALIGRQRELRRELVDKRGAHFDSLVVDAGWENTRSMWEFHPARFPHGFDTLFASLQGTKTEIGLWHPLAHPWTDEDAKWFAQQGYEMTHDGREICLAGPKYNAALRAGLRDKLLRYRLNCFKFDFNVFDCAAAGHGHLPEARYGREANVDATIEMLQYLTSLRKDVYLNPTTGQWLSPWWLPYCDTVWMDHCGDFGYLKNVPALEPRDWALTYRDTCLYQNLRQDRSQFPISAIMTIGMIDGQLNRLGGEHEPLDRWANDVMDNMARGSMLKELYLTPGLLDSNQWDILARAIRWQERHLEAMARGRMIGGDPSKGEVYGYFHPGKDTSVLCLRNPTMDERGFDFALSGDGPRLPLLVYPYCEAREVAKQGATIRFHLAPHELIACELWRPEAMKIPFPKCVRFGIEDVVDGRIRFRTFSRDAEVAPTFTASQSGVGQWTWSSAFNKDDRAKFVALLRGNDLPARKAEFHLFLDDRELPLTSIEGEGWLALSADLPAQASATLRLERRGNAPCELAARLLVEESLPSARVVLPLPRGAKLPVFPLTPLAHVQRRSLVLLEPTKLGAQ